MTLGIDEKYFMLIKNFYYAMLDGTESHRFKAWEYCYKYFHDNRRKLQKNSDLPEEAVLVFGFYLASWGMYRGSSFLLLMDHTIHREILTKLMDKKYDILTTDISQLSKEEEKEKFISALLNARKEIIDYYCPLRKKAIDQQNQFHESISISDAQSKELPKNDISDILASKILLGVFGCVPAYDNLFKKGIKHIWEKGKNERYPISSCFTTNSAKQILQFYDDNKSDIDEHEFALKVDETIKYPTMKKIDMLFWLEGYKHAKKRDES